MSSEKVLIKEKYLPDNTGTLGGKTTSTLDNGSIDREVRIPFCSCGTMLKDAVFICMACGKKLCVSCKIIHENTSYCRDCAKNIISIEKNSYKMLKVGNEIDIEKDELPEDPEVWVFTL